MKANKRINKRIRGVVQLIFFILVGLIATNHVLTEKGVSIPFLSNASLHAICPLGGIVSLYQLFSVGTFVQKIHQSSFAIMLIVFVLTIGFGAVFCGWVCPLGTIQEWAGRIGRKLFKNRYNSFIPYKLDKYLRYVRYGVLAWVLYVTGVTGKLIFSTYDPFHAMYTFWSGEVAAEAIIILSITIVLSLFVERPWCKYACPLGAVYGLSNLFRIFKLNRNDRTCTSCGVCDKTCPMNIKISTAKLVKNHQCIGCLKCTSDIMCPVPDTVNLSLKGGK